MSSEAAAPATGWGRSGGPSLAETGEVAVLQRLLELVPAQERLLLGPGDDAALWRPEPGCDVVLSQDATVEGVDFVRRWSAPRQVGHRALVVALSDLAGMGARPAWCQATLCASGDTHLEDVMELQRGIVEAAAAFGCAVAGGDLSDTTGPLVVDITVGGEVRGGRWLERGAGRPGDVLLLSGEAGGAAAGLRALWGDPGAAEAPEGVRRAWIERQLTPRPRLREGMWLVGHDVRCGGDTSDGLLADAARTAAACGCGVELWRDAVPAAPGIRECFGDRWAEVALGGGEDFELLVVVAAAAAGPLLAAWPAELAPLRRVGRLVEAPGLRLLDVEGGEEVELPPVRSRHWA